MRLNTERFTIALDCCGKLTLATGCRTATATLADTSPLYDGFDGSEQNEIATAVAGLRNLHATRATGRAA